MSLRTLWVQLEDILTLKPEAQGPKALWQGPLSPIGDGTGEAGGLPNYQDPQSLAR